MADNSAETVHGSPWRLVQLTDSHLFSDPGQRLMGMDTRASFDAVTELVELEQGRVDLVLGTGDITQDNSETAYRYYWDRANQLAERVVWIPGNHDEAETQRALKFSAGATTRVLDNQHWRIVLLNSSVSGRVYGYLAAEELVALEEALADAGNRHVLVALHHHPIPSGAHWLDEHCLHNPDELNAVIARYNAVRVLLWGHIHQHVEKVRNGVLHLATPSTCIQFAPRQYNFKLDDLPPGYRWLELYPDGHVETDISRIDLDLPVDLEGNGY